MLAIEFNYIFYFELCCTFSFGITRFNYRWFYH